MTGNPLETRRKCSDCELFEFRLDVNFTVKARLDGETPPPNRPVYVACILSLCPGLDKSEIINAHLAEDELKQIARHVGEQEATGDGRNVQHDFSNFARDSVVEDALYVLFCECSLMSVGCPVQFLFLVFP